MIKYPYRFKTEQEFIECFGIDWQNVIKINHKPNWCPDMDNLFGTVFPFTENGGLRTIKDSPIHPIHGRYLPSFENERTWLISWDMLIKCEPVKPNYEPKKIIRSL